MKFLLIVLSFGEIPTSQVIDDYDTAQGCFDATYTQKIQKDQFSVCAGTDEASEQALAVYIHNEFYEPSVHLRHDGSIVPTYRENYK